MLNWNISLVHLLYGHSRGYTDTAEDLGLHKKNHGHQVKVGDPASLLCSLRSHLYFVQL